MEVDEPTPSTSAAAATAGAGETSSGSTSNSNVLASAGTAGSVSVSLHPLVIMNISEHWTRTKAQQGAPKRVYGALIGKQAGRDVEIMNSFELDVQEIDGAVSVDKDYYTLKESQFKQVFSDMDFLGWYTTGETPVEDDINVHRQICDINESPLCLLLNPAARHTDLPVTVYESVIDIVSGEARMLFVKLGYSLKTEEAERIGLDHVARITGLGAEDESQSKVAEHVSVQHSAIKMLSGRVKIILEYVKAVEKGDLPYNHEIMRQAKALSSRLPVLENERFEPEFYEQYNDAALVTYLGAVMKSCNNMNQFINKFNILYQRQGTGRRMRGLFF